MEIKYQEGAFWMSRLQQDRESLETALRDVKALKEKPDLLGPSVRLYKSLKELSSNFSGYSNVPSFSALIGDLALEMELWGDPVFYKLHVLPLAQRKDKETESKPVPTEKKLPPKTKKP